VFDKEKARAFLPVLAKVVEDYPDFQFPAYFQAKLMLALGNKENLLASITPFAWKKRNEFWVWDIISEAVSADPEKVFACYCKALSCNSPEEMLVKLRQRMAEKLVSMKLYNEAKTEIELLVKARTESGYRIPGEVFNWQSADWYKQAQAQPSNQAFYKKHLFIAEELLYADVPEETVIVEFVNSDKQVLNFIASQSKFGFFKYGRLLSTVQIGDVLKVRFQGGSNEGAFQVLTVVKADNDAFKQQYMRDLDGKVRISQGRPFGFVDDVYIHPSIIARLKLVDGAPFTGKAIKTYNKEKRQWGWKVVG